MQCSLDRVWFSTGFMFVSLYYIKHVFVNSVENSQACACEFRRDHCIVLGEVGIEFRFLPRLRLASTPFVWFSLSGSDCGVWGLWRSLRVLDRVGGGIELLTTGMVDECVTFRL